MGNRAVIAMNEYDDNAIGIYLHWNGGRDSVEGFLEATKRIMASRGEDESYAAARLVEAIGLFMSGNASFGLGKVGELDCDNYDNGVYVVDMKKLEIIDRVFQRGDEQQIYKPAEIADCIMKKRAAAEAVKDE